MPCVLYFLDYSCSFVTGDGVGGTEQNIAYQPTPQACIDACANRKQKDPKINGVTIILSGTGICYCEKKMEKSNGNPLWKTCKLIHNGSNKCSFFFLDFIPHLLATCLSLCKCRE